MTNQGAHASLVTYNVLIFFFTFIKLLERLFFLPILTERSHRGLIFGNFNTLSITHLSILKITW